MPEQEGKQPRRILDVDVNEVSLVDRAANLRRFLVIKRREEEEVMGAFKTDDVEKKKQMEEEEEKKKAKEEEEAKEKAKAKEEEEAKEKAKAKEEEEAKEKAMNPKAIAGMLRGLKGAPKEAVSQVVDWLEAQKAAKQEEEDEYPSPKAKAKKSVDGDVEPAVQMFDDGTIVVKGQPVYKGKKFTASRTNAIKDVTMTLLKLIGEVDPETMKSIEEALKALPRDPKWTPAIQATGTSGAKKAAEEEEDKEKKDLKKQVAELTKRLESIEETRKASTALEGDDTDKKDVKKGLWDGVL